MALGALHAGCALGVGYPGTPSTEILQNFSLLGGNAQWAPNEKVAAEVALGVAYAESNALATMKHVGFNVASDLYFTASYSGVQGAFVTVVADDPGMASSQNEQDTRSMALVGGIPVLEPSDSQEAYDFVRLAFQLSRQWQIPVIVRVTTRICHSYTIVECDEATAAPIPAASYTKDIPTRVMIPGHARPAHRRLRKKLADLLEWNLTSGPNKIIEGANDDLGIISGSVAYQHAREAAPDAGFFKVGMSLPLPVEQIVAFTKKYKRCVVVEEGDPYMTTLLRAAGANVEERNEKWRFGELTVTRVRGQIANDLSPEPTPMKAKPPQLCKGCPHWFSFAPLVENDYIVVGDIGCYTLAALKPLAAMDIQTCMGASIGMGLGMRHVLPEAQARKVVSIIGDSTFMHTGLPGLLEMVYNRPATGHIVIVVDNGTTAMTGMQDHPGTGRLLSGEPAHTVDITTVSKAIGIENVETFVPAKDKEAFVKYLAEKSATNELTLIILKQACILAAGKRAKG